MLQLHVRGPFGSSSFLGRDPFSDAESSQEGRLLVTGAVIRRGAWTDAIQLRYGGAWGRSRGGDGGSGTAVTFDGGPALAGSGALAEAGALRTAWPATAAGQAAFPLPLSRPSTSCLPLPYILIHPGSEEYISEAYVSVGTFLNHLELRTNLGTTIGGGTTAMADLVRAHPCAPGASFRLAYISAPRQPAAVQLACPAAPAAAFDFPRAPVPGPGGSPATPAAAAAAAAAGGDAYSGPSSGPYPYLLTLTLYWAPVPAQSSGEVTSVQLLRGQAICYPPPPAPPASPSPPPGPPLPPAGSAAPGGPAAPCAVKGSPLLHWCTTTHGALLALAGPWACGADRRPLTACTASRRPAGPGPLHHRRPHTELRRRAALRLWRQPHLWHHRLLKGRLRHRRHRCHLRQLHQPRQGPHGGRRPAGRQGQRRGL